MQLSCLINSGCFSKMLTPSVGFIFSHSAHLMSLDWMIFCVHVVEPVSVFCMVRCISNHHTFHSLSLPVALFSGILILLILPNSIIIPYNLNFLHVKISKGVLICLGFRVMFSKMLPSWLLLPIIFSLLLL